MKPFPRNCTVVRYSEADDVVILVRPFRRPLGGGEGCMAVRLYPNAENRAGSMTVEEYNATRPGNASPRGVRVYKKLLAEKVFTRYRATREVMDAIAAGGVRQPLQTKTESTKNG